LIVSIIIFVAFNITLFVLIS